MRNLKRALSLALASVMLLGMMVVGTSAASYPDVDENDNVEAIEVLNAVSVMIGDRGNFRPDAAVNRHEMATIMAKLVLGVETADNYVGTHPFTDVFPWADKYVAACYENGLVAGTSATTFGGNQPLTAVQAAAMMLRALGYKDLSKGATDWRAPVTAMANQIRLFDGVASNPSEQLTRNQVAQLALNTLKSPMVNLKDNTISWSNDEGQIIMTGGSREYIALSSNEAYAKAINDTEKAGTSASQIAGFTVELGEHLYNGKLKLNNNYLDVFGRPARHWEFDGKEIGSYIKEELMVMDNVGEVTGNDLYSLLGASTIKDYDTLVTIDGVANDRSDAKDILGYPNGAYFDEADMNRNNKAAVGATGTGVLTQVFVDHEKDEVYVAVINTYLARADRDYDDKSEEATLTVYGIDEYRTEKEYVKLKGSNETMKVQAEDFTGLETIKKDDPFLVTVADGEIQTMVEDEVLEGVTLTAFKKGDHVVSDGTEYAYTTTATYDSATLDNYTGIDGKTNLKDISYNIYLDAYGNLIGIKEIDAVKNYVFLAGIDVDGSNLYSKTATANALFLDGTSKTIKINLSKSKFPTHRALNNTNVVISGDALLNTWCTYTVSSDNVYTVTEAYATRVNPDHPSFKDINANPNNYPGGGDNKTKLAQTWQPAAGLKEDNFTVDVKRMRLHGTDSGDGSRFANVYGDSTSVYLTATLDELFNDSNSLNVDKTVEPAKPWSYGIIKDVDAVTTGVADVSIKVLTKEDARKTANDNGDIDSQYPGATANGIYTLYDNEGIVIASVVVGENDGVKDLVYVHTDTLDLESYNSTDDIWTWTRRVVFNGQETTLTEKDSELSELKTMKQFHWYEIKRNADGNVISVVPAYRALYNADTEKNAFVHEYEMINTTVEATSKDTVLYQTEDGPLPADDNGAVTGHAHYGFYKQKLDVIGTNTLAVEKETGSGIHFRDNVNVVLQYWNRNTEQTEIETGTGVDRLKSMVDFVNKNTETRDSDHPYYLSAVIEKGFATTIVIYDSFNSYNRPDAPAGNYELTLGGVLNSIYTTPANLNSDVYIVNSDNSISYVESNDDVATSTVNGYKRYTVPYGKTIRVYDNDVANDFQPFFSPIKPLSDYHYYKPATSAQRAYFEFTVPVSIRLENDKLTIRERLSTDPVYVSIDSDAEATVTINGTTTTYKPGQSFTVTPGQTITVVPTTAGDKVYVNGNLCEDGKYKVQPGDTELVITTKPGVTPPDPDKKYYTVTFTENGAAEVKNFTTDVAEQYEENTAVEITITANEGYELVSVGGEAAEAGAKTATWSTEKITANVTVDVVTKATTPAPSTDLTVTSGVEANVAADQIGKALTLTVKGGASNKWYIVTGTDVPEYSCAQADVNGDVMFTYTPSGDKVTITLTETKFMTNPLTGAPCLFGEVSEGQYGMIDYTKLTISGMKSRAAVGDTSGNMEGALVSMTVGGETVYFVNTYVNDKLTLVMTDLDEKTVGKLNDAIQNAETDEDGLVQVELVKEEITTDGAASVTTNEDGNSVINFDLGAPAAKGVKLPTEVTIDGKVTAKVKWYYNGAAIDPDTGDIFAWEDNLNGYRYEILEPTEVTEGSLSFPVKVVYPNDPADSEEIASNDDLKKVVVVWNDVKPDQKPAEDPSVLTDWELVGTTYTFSYHTEANRPSVHDIEKVIKQDQSAYAVEVDLTGNSGTADVTKTEGATAIADAFTVVLKPKTAVILDDNDSKPVCWLDKANSAQALEGVKAGTVLIASGDRDITIGTPISLASVNPNTYADEGGNLPDYLYVYTAIPVATLASDSAPFFQVTFKGWKGMSAEDKEDAAISALLTSRDFAVRPGTELQIEGTVPGDGKTYELQINGKYVEGISSRKSGVVSSDKCNYGTVTIDESLVATKTVPGDDATKGTVTFREAGEVITVKLGEDSYYVVTSEDLKIEGLTAGKSYIRKELTDASADTVNGDGILTLETVTDADGKADDVITLHEAYAFTQDATVIEDGTSTGDSKVHTAKVVKAGKELVTPVTASSDEKALAYVEVGATVYLWAMDEDTSLVSETLGDTLVAVPSKNATINGENRYCYSFVMPAERVVDIKADVGMTITDDGNITNLLAAGGKHVITVTLTPAVEGAELVIPADPWTNVSGELKGSVPPGMSDKIAVKKTVAGKTWTITLTADPDKTGVTPSTYYLKFTVNGVDVIQTITVPAPTAVSTFTIAGTQPNDAGIKYGASLTDDVKVHGSQLKAATESAATVGTWTWCAADATPNKTNDTAVTKVTKAGKYTLWVPAEAAVGYTFATTDWAGTAALKIDSKTGTYDATNKVIGYTFTFALPTITVAPAAGTAAVPASFTAGTKEDGATAAQATGVDMSTGANKIDGAGVSAIQGLTSLDVGGVTVNLSSVDITADTSTMTEVLAAIQAAVDAAVNTNNNDGANGSADYNKIENVAVAADGTAGFKVTFEKTPMTYDAGSVAVAPKTDVTFDAALTGADVNGVVITVDGKKFEFVVTGDVVGAGNTKVQVAADADKDAIATAFAGAVNTAATGMDHVSAASASGAKATITGKTTETEEIAVSYDYAVPAASNP